MDATPSRPLLLLLAALSPAAAALEPLRSGTGAAAATITSAELERHVEVLAGPESEGRDSPSPPMVNHGSHRSRRRLNRFRNRIDRIADSDRISPRFKCHPPFLCDTFAQLCR
jgi:hypothetical protein